MDFSEVEKFIDTPVKRYSSGMYLRLAFAVAAHLEPEILVVDEVLAVGDAEFQRKCLGKMSDVAAGRAHGAVCQPQYVCHPAPDRRGDRAGQRPAGAARATPEAVDYYLSSGIRPDRRARLDAG